MISDRELGEQLYAFMRVVPSFWAWNDLLRLLETHDSHVEYRGPPDQLISFSLQVIQHWVTDSEDWLDVWATVADPSRGRGLGGSYVPLLGHVIVHRDGKIEFTLLGNGSDASDSFQPPELASIAVHG